MKFGVREICDVVLKAKANQKIGNKIFYKDEPVLYFDTLKTSSLEGTAETVYATGGHGNTRLAAWEGERTVTFTMEDALISPVGFSILSGAGLIDATADKPIIQHMIETIVVEDGVVVEGNEVKITLSDVPHIAAKGDSIYVMILDDNGEVISEPFIGVATEGSKEITINSIAAENRAKAYAPTDAYAIYDEEKNQYSVVSFTKAFETARSVLVDYYVARKSNAQQIDITADKFGGTFYLEASTLFRDVATGADLPAEFIIPKCKIQSNFTFSMASTGDPSTFTFTMDAFPDYTRFNPDKKVLAAIQIFGSSASGDELIRESTRAGHTHHEDTNGTIKVGKDEDLEGVTNA